MTSDDLIQINTGLCGARIIELVRKSGTSMIVLIHTFLLGVMLAFASSGAYAHVSVNPDREQGITFDTPPYELGCCMMLAQGQHLHCDQAPLPLQATGPAQSDDNQPALIALSTSPLTPVAGMVPALTATALSITGPPAFILFGNFRS